MGVDKASFTRQDQKDGGAEDGWGRLNKKIIKGEQISKSCCCFFFVFFDEFRFKSCVTTGGGVWTNVWNGMWPAHHAIDPSPLCDNVPLFDMEHQHCLATSHQHQPPFMQNPRLACGLHGPGSAGLPHNAFIGQLSSALSLGFHSSEPRQLKFLLELLIF